VGWSRPKLVGGLIASRGHDVLQYCTAQGDVKLRQHVGTLGAFATYQAEVVHVAMDESGVIPEALAAAISRMSAQGGGSSSLTPFRPSTARQA
jgi:hypothetical protein